MRQTKQRATELDNQDREEAVDGSTTQDRSTDQDLADLTPAPDDQAEVKGGPSGFGSGYSLNHNETLADEPEADSPKPSDDQTPPQDLPPTAADQSEVKGGPSGPSGIRFNHNETLV
ncbi:MAG: hypothetical protein KDI56_08625 [Xanthomonadales bacterium]|nr:hypothetical protein [Xanthomonadales bacterium]MCB1627312.1 hypothetical protein [Xanthomonadales bacterium]MCB1633791.1 hypothetical protein [Xanthomonadales bacterium]